MATTRRDLLSGCGMGALATLTALRPSQVALAADESGPSSDKLLPLFKELPGDVAVRIHAPAANGKAEYAVRLNSTKRMFVGSAIKTFVLCEILRQADSPQVVQALVRPQLELDARVWSPDSATFNPPNLTGKASLRTCLEAMILHSDNTATDMCLKHVGPDRVRNFIASIGLKNTMIPDSTRSLFGYLLGAKDYRGFTWEQINAATDAPIVNSPLNTVETMASTADDFVSYYSRAIQGAFFKRKETLDEFRRILAMGDAIWLLPLPLGVSAFCKGGSIDVAGFHAIAAPGAMFCGNRWIYFFIAINWYAKNVSDPATLESFVAAASRALAMAKEAIAG
jgi:beta-lactamase class A